jgi:voltage-gated sodium channel
MLASPNQAPWKQKIEAFIAYPFIQHTLVAFIIINAVILGMETSPYIMDQIGPVLIALDHGILWVFIAEIVLLIAARGLHFFKDPWAVFDFIVVGIALVPATGSLSVLRALRVLRVLRLINKIESMRRVVSGLLSSLPSLGSVFGLILVIFYVSAVIATNVFGTAFPDWFGNLATSSFTLFQVMTLEGWSDGIARPVMQVFPHAWIFFLIFILIATFVIVNLFIAVIVDSLTSINPAAVDAQNQTKALQFELKALREELSQMRQELSHLHLGANE